MTTSTKQKIQDLSRELYAGNTKVNPVLYCSNGIYKITIDKPAPKFKGDKYCFMHMYEYNSYTRQFEIVSSYGATHPQDISFELRERFSI